MNRYWSSASTPSRLAYFRWVALAWLAVACGPTLPSTTPLGEGPLAEDEARPKQVAVGRADHLQPLRPSPLLRLQLLPWINREATAALHGDWKAQEMMLPISEAAFASTSGVLLDDPDGRRD